MLAVAAVAATGVAADGVVTTFFAVGPVAGGVAATCAGGGCGV